MTFKAHLYKWVYPLAKLYWFLVRPKTAGALCVIECEGEILLIKNTYGDHSYSFPGGGVKTKEIPSEAVVREVQEEVGLMIINVEAMGSFLYTRQYKRDTIYIFSARVVHKDIAIEKDEILEARWFSSAEIPESELSNIGLIILQKYKKYLEDKISA